MLQHETKKMFNRKTTFKQFFVFFMFEKANGFTSLNKQNIAWNESVYTAQLLYVHWTIKNHNLNQTVLQFHSFTFL